MTKVVISKSFGSGFGPTNKTVDNWLNQHGGEGLVKELKTVFCVEEYDETLYDVEIGGYDGEEWIELVPILDVELMTEMSADELADYLDEKGVKHNYSR